ncbi:MAG: hypothetical protein CVV42_14540 [Candidatus Riflebacteria bacterium HGW-Riflebacteria-2]|jgi:hypothetical protein|nr:MAG: hypothetical protein CVV42_14540 [Candidatus Riflebacteria bacterium HGW-Riflebacteria-2]
MANEISLFDLERLSNSYQIRIWQCRKLGRRWSFIDGAGPEKVLPSQLVYEEGDLGFFVQAESFDEASLVDELKKLVKKSICC